MTLGDRINLFIHCCYQSQYNFAIQIKINRGYLNRIINNKIHPGVDILSKFVSSGLSVDWLIEGKGSMFAENQIGNNLKMKIIGDGSEDNNNLSSRLLSWISKNHDNLESFCNIYHIDYHKYFKIIFESAIPDIEFIDTIKQAGCNINWLYTGNGSHNINKNGEMFKN